MSRCARTSSLLDARFAGADLTRSEAAHVVGCSECAHALAQVGRFDAELGRVGVDLSPEPMPPAPELTAVSTPRLRGGSMMTWRRNLVGGAITAVVLVLVVFAGGQWIGSLVEGRVSLGGFMTPAQDEARAEAKARADAESAARRQALALAQAAEDADLDAWLEGAVAAAWTAAGEPGEAQQVDFVRVERCEELYTVLFEGPEGVSTDYYWAAGHRLDGSAAHAGLADSLDEASLARARAATGLPCTRVVDSTVGEAEISVTVERMRGLPGDVALLDRTMLDPDLAVAVMEGFNSDGNHQRWIGLVRRQDGGWTSVPEEWIGANIPSNDGFTTYDVAQLNGGLESTDVIVGALPSGAAALELVVDGTVHRYDVEPGSPGIVVTAPRTPLGQVTFRVLDSDGDPMHDGIIPD